MKKALQKIGITFALAVVFCIVFVVCASAKSVKVEYRNDLYGYDTGNLKDATWTKTTDEDGWITLESSQITAGDDHEFFGWFTVEGDVYSPGQRVQFTKDTQLFEAYGERIKDQNTFVNNTNNIMTSGLFLLLETDIIIGGNPIYKTFNGIMNLNGHTISMEKLSNNAQAWGENASRYVFVGQGTINHYSSNEKGYLFMAKGGGQTQIKDPTCRLWIGKNVTINTSGALINAPYNSENCGHFSVRIYGTVNARYLAQGFLCDDGENVSVNPGNPNTRRNYYAKIDIFETAKITITGDKFIDVQNETGAMTRGPAYEGEVLHQNYHAAITYVTVTAHGGTFDLGTASESTTFWFDEERFSGKWNYNFLAGTFKYQFPASLLDVGYYWSGSEGNWVIKTSKCTNSDGHKFTINEKYYGTTPTCLVAGTWLQKCDYCDYVNETYADPLGHDYKLTSSTPATSTTTGSGTWTCQRDNCDGPKTVERKLYPTIDIMQKVIVTVITASGDEIQIELTIADIFEYELIDANGDSDHVLNIKAIKAYGEYSVEQIIGINLPFGVTQISLPANSTLKYIDLSRTSDITLLDKTFADFKALVRFVFGNNMSVGGYVFQNCTSLSEVILAGVSNISFNGTSIFSGCTSLVEFAIGDNCHSIYVTRQTAFGNASALKIFRVGDNCTDIRFEPQYVFEGSSNMEELHFGKSEIFFGGSSMRTTGGTSPINVLTFTSGGEYTLSNECFRALSIKELIFPDGMIINWADNSGAFRACPYLEYLYVGRGIKELKSTFDQCNGLRFIVLMDVEIMKQNYCFCASTSSPNYPLTVYIHSTTLDMNAFSFQGRTAGVTIYTTAAITNSSAFNNMNNNFTIYYGVPHAFEQQQFDATCTEGAHYGYGYTCPGCGSGDIENGTVVKKFVGVMTNNSNYEEIVLEKTYLNGPEGFGHTADRIISIIYKDGFFKKGVKTIVCATCGQEAEIEAVAIFKALGYSVEENGSAIMGGYKLNYITDELTALAEYESLYGTLTYGVIFVNVNAENLTNLNFVDGVIQTENGAIKAVQAEITDAGREFSQFKYKVSGFKPKEDPMYAELNLIIAAYVLDEDKNITFGQADSCEKGGNITYTKNVTINGTEQTLGAVTLKELYQNSEYSSKYPQYFI